MVPSCAAPASPHPPPSPSPSPRRQHRPAISDRHLVPPGCRLSSNPQGQLRGHIAIKPSPSPPQRPPPQMRVPYAHTASLSHTHTHTLHRLQPTHLKQHLPDLCLMPLGATVGAGGTNNLQVWSLLLIHSFSCFCFFFSQHILLSVCYQAVRLQRNQTRCCLLNLQHKRLQSVRSHFLCSILQILMEGKTETALFRWRCRCRAELTLVGFTAASTVASMQTFFFGGGRGNATAG